MHVVRQIADAVVATLQAEVPAFAEVYRYGTPPSGMRRWPIAVVMPGDAAVETQLSGNRRSGRVQTRTLQLGVAMRDLVLDGEDYSARIGDLAAAVERALAGWDVLPIEDITLDSDSGVQDVDEDAEEGVHVGQALNFQLRFFTREGDAAAFIEPNR